MEGARWKGAECGDYYMQHARHLPTGYTERGASDSAQIYTSAIKNYMKHMQFIHVKA
jgi:hypothetical protein